MPAILTYADLPPEVQDKLGPLFDAVDWRRYGEAIPGLSAIVDAHPAYVHGVFVLGKALRATDDRETANRRFKAAFESFPDDSRLCLGVAWARLDEDDFPGAEELAARALPDAAVLIRGDVLEVLALAAEADDRDDEAARLYLEAYETGTMLNCLAAHCRLVGIDYDIERERAPWPIGAVVRQWMYTAVCTELLRAARARKPDEAPRLVVGCEGTARVTGAWAISAGVERARLYQALAARGGFCDCEVLMNAARDDDETRGYALVAGAVDGSLEDALLYFDGLLEEEPPATPPKLAAGELDDDDAPGIFVAPDGKIPLQRTTSSSVGELLHALADEPPRHARFHLLIGFVDEPPAVVVIGRELGRPQVRLLLDDTIPLDLEKAWPGFSRALGALRAVISPPGGARG